MSSTPMNGGPSKEPPVEAYLKSIGKTRKQLFAEIKLMNKANSKIARKGYRAAKMAGKLERKMDNRKMRRQGLSSLINKPKPPPRAQISGVQIPEAKSRFGQFLSNGVYTLDNVGLVVITKPRFPRDILEQHHKEDILRLFKCHCAIQRISPAINGSYYIGGACLVVCENKETFKQFELFAENTKLLEDGTEIIFGGSEVLSKYFLIKCKFPGELNDQECFIRKLTVQNPAYCVGDWILKSTKNEVNKFHCLFKIPEGAFKPLALTNFAICYNLDAVKAYLLVDIVHKKKIWIGYRQPKNPLKSLY